MRGIGPAMVGALYLAGCSFTVDYGPPAGGPESADASPSAPDAAEQSDGGEESLLHCPGTPLLSQPVGNLDDFLVTVAGAGEAAVDGSSLILGLGQNGDVNLFSNNALPFDDSRLVVTIEPPSRKDTAFYFGVVSQEPQVVMEFAIYDDKLFAEKREDSIQTDSGNWIYAPDQHKHLRIRDLPEGVVFEAAGDGGPWQNLMTMSYAGAVDRHLNIGAFTLLDGEIIDQVTITDLAWCKEKP